MYFYFLTYGSEQRVKNEVDLSFHLNLSWGFESTKYAKKLYWDEDKAQGEKKKKEEEEEKEKKNRRGKKKRNLK